MFQKGHKFGKGGKRPGAGRPQNRIREKCARAFDALGIPILTGIAKDSDERTADRIAALHELARVGIASQHEHDVKLPTSVNFTFPELPE